MNVWKVAECGCIVWALEGFVAMEEAWIETVDRIPGAFVAHTLGGMLSPQVGYEFFTLMRVA